MSANISPIKKILVLRFSSIGDIVLTSPVIRCLKLQTNCSLHYLVMNKFKQTLIGNPYVDKLISFEKEPQEVLDGLKEENYDYIVDLHKNIRTKRLLANLGKPYANFPKKNVEKWLFVNFKINKMPDVHIVDRYFEALRELNVQNDQKGLDYFIPEADHINPESFGLMPNEYIAFGIGAAHNTKVMPTAEMEKLLVQFDKKIALIGGPNEASKGEHLANDKRVNFCGKLNINQTASLIKQASVVISPDTGIMHIAAALRKKIVSIWGNTVPAFGMYPYYGKNKVDHFISEVEDLSCRPCSKIGYKKCPKGHFRCMKEQDLNQIVEWVEGDLS